MLRAEHQQELRVRENAANCEQLKSEMDRREYNEVSGSEDANG